MKPGVGLDATFRILDADRLYFKSNHDPRRMMMLLFIVLSSLYIASQLLDFFTMEDFYNHTFRGEGRSFTYVGAIVLSAFFSLWMIAPKREIYFERKNQSIRYKARGYEFVFPWEQVVSSTHWELTKYGTTEWLSINLKPPFPEALARQLDKKGRTPEGTVRGVVLGTVIVNSPEHAAAMFAFLDTWMRTDQPALELYEKIVRQPFQS